LDVEQADMKPDFTILAYTTSWCPDCADAHKVLKRSGLPFSVVDVELVPGAEEAMIEAAQGVRKVPTILIDSPLDRKVLIEPSDKELSDALQELKSVVRPE
jgi:glutaredoxin